VRIGFQTASGLAAAHAQGLIHRDIKPANLLLENGLARVRITDFGLARMADDAQMTQQGVVAGTPEYMAPEQARGDKVDHRADLFSLGSVLYAICTGRPPFHGSTSMAVLRQTIDQEPAAIRECNPEIPEWLETLVARLMAKNPADRFQSAAEVAELLEGYLAYLRQPTTVAAPALPPSYRGASKGLSRLGFLFGSLRRMSPLVWLPALVPLAAVVLGMGLWVLRDDAPAKQAPESDKAKLKRAHVAFDFRAGMAKLPAFTLNGPDVDEVATTDSQGLRVRIPEGQGDTRPIELELAHRLRGDLDIVLSYELITVGKPWPMYGTGVVMRVWFDAPSTLSAIVSRVNRPAGETFGAHKIVAGPDGNDRYINNMAVKATKSRGKLRLVRTGSELQYLVAEEGQGFKVIQAVEIGTYDLKDLKVLFHTMYKPIALDTRVTELVIDADQFPDGVPIAESAPPPPVVSEAKESVRWLAAGGIISLITLLSVLGVELYVRQRRRLPTVPERAVIQGKQSQSEAGSPPLSVTCSNCGKNLKVEAQLAGKKVSCTHCGKPTLVPVIPVALPTEASPTVGGLAQGETSLRAGDGSGSCNQDPNRHQ